MLPPHTVFSMAFRNNNSGDVEIEVTYENMHHKLEKATLVVPSYGSAKTEERFEVVGTATFWKPIVKIAAVVAPAQGSSPSLSAPFPLIDGPTTHYVVEIVKKNGKLTLVAKGPS